MNESHLLQTLCFAFTASSQVMTHCVFFAVSNLDNLDNISCHFLHIVFYEVNNEITPLYVDVKLEILREYSLESAYKEKYKCHDTEIADAVQPICNNL